MIAPPLRPAIPLPGWTNRLKVGLVALFVVIVLALRGVAEDAAPTGARTEVHFAFSRTMFAEVNENDAKAAMKAYTQSIGDQNGIYVNSAPKILDGANAIAKALEFKQADLLALTAEELFVLEDRGLEGPLLLAKVNDSFTENYMLLSREDSSIRQMEDLKGRSLILSGDARASLANLWLEVLLWEHGLGRATQVLAKVTSASKATQVVLPVFFGKTDACIITRNGWEVMCELNPQLEKQLRVVAVSPPVVPALTCFRRGFTEAFKQQIITAMDLSATKPAYKQLMTLFKSDGLGHAPLEALDGTRELVATYRRLCALTNAAPSGNGSSARAETEARSP